MTQPNAQELKKLDRLIHQHPAALRSVSWYPQSHTHSLQHLELETKHGQVVVFDHRRPVLYSQPPKPADTLSPRLWHDLSAEIPEAFNNRPTIEGFEFDLESSAWVILLSTGIKLIFTLDERRPSLRAI
jgi:hypothetical protein